MAPIYKILSEFTSDPDPDRISVNPFWVMAVIRYNQPLTFSRVKMLAGESAANHNVDPDIIIREKSMLVLSDDIASMTVTHNKNSYTSSLQATFLNGELNYLTEIQPDDWVLVWMVNDETFGRQLIDRILKREAVNEFKDGLKFVGKVQSIRKSVQQAATGIRTVRYQLQAAGFKEFDASVYFDPALSQAELSIGQWMARLDKTIEDIYSDSAQGVTTTKAVPTLLRLLIGEGIPPDAASPGDVEIATGGLSTPAAPYSYVIPATVLSLLGQSKNSKAMPSYADILDLVLGLQKYEEPAPNSRPEILFSPAGAGSDSNFRILNEKLMGTFQPLPVSFNGKSVWSLLEEFKNPAVNEMYTALRINADGLVVPTLTVRQLPFSTPYAMDSEDAQSLTGFLELPRWFCDPILINAFDIGKTDALRVNFVHVYGQASHDAGVDLTFQIVAHPPIRDEQDIKRNGLRPHMQTVACSIDDQFDDPEKWMRILSDFLIGQQFTLNGSCSLIGIQAPICPGDNFELDDVVYHIESVTHSCSNNQGFRQFNTTLTLTHGMRTDSSQSREAAVVKTTTVSDQDGPNKEFLIYSGTKASDNIGYDPGQTVDSKTKTQVADPEEERRLGADMPNETDEGVA